MVSAVSREVHRFSAFAASLRLRTRSFAGHIHHDLGAVGNITVGARSVKVFRTGSSVYQRFLVVEFADHLLRVGKIDSSDGTPKLLGPDPVEEVRF